MPEDSFLDSPRIINIVNFIRQTDYRIENSDNLLFEAVENQIKLVNEYNFPATFLFQYDALINPAYQQLMKTQLSPDCEIGAWWEITQPHVEAAGIKWRGEHSWVSHANIAFTTGYTPEEREKLVDVYMSKFKEIYGEYPRSVGSWFIDAHTLSYMVGKYKIVSSSNCKDQVGTDGYTLWGGYWNQAYYPSRYNAYMPAQTKENQIPVPVFRMLGSDPIYQYETGVGTNGQGVISLEPVYRESGKNREWVKYFLESIVNQPSLAFNYAQAGQENSFTWSGMEEGLKMQFPLFASLREEGKIRIETLENTGKWFKDRFTMTPATAITTLTDIRNEGNKTVWFNSRFYRASLLWEKDGFCFRDIHMFDENLKSDYLTAPGTGNQFFYYTLPVIDRFYWSTPEEKTGLQIMQLEDDGTVKEVVLKDPIVTEPSIDVLCVSTSDSEGNRFEIVFYENKIDISYKGDKKDFKWMMVLKVPESRKDRLPFESFEGTVLRAKFKGFPYKITCEGGFIQKGDKTEYDLKIVPNKHKLVINCANR
ncbi:hypothetical protein [uncultured Proteiniphilum sp.]|uniref:hypothetical protein n=1 Tax=uncultured Proteiniphilum sp. TaxID=497637 RepID=UPI002614C991|nr:hypothetical protein [uncultured Proteiniphilum sp.]